MSTRIAFDCARTGCPGISRRGRLPKGVFGLRAGQSERFKRLSSNSTPAIWNASLHSSPRLVGASKYVSLGFDMRGTLAQRREWASCERGNDRMVR